MEINPEFIAFYKENLNLSHTDFINFIETLNKPLPITFRVLDRTLHTHISKFSSIKKIKNLEDTYECINSDEYKSSNLQNLIKNYTQIKKVYRQEIVSMFPVYFLDIQPSNYVFDMCAAPGSKSIQILEKVKDGLLISNDSDFKRCSILCANLAALCNPNLLVTNNNARCYPSIFCNGNELLFDKILCDVPCSGDATLRKSPDLRSKWKLNTAIGNMKTQYDILRRGLNMLKNDGLLVYSTCSFNPLENECIVQRAVMECDCEIVNLNLNFEHNFIFREGLTTWNPQITRTDKNEWYFPVNKDIGLSKCIRIYPQDQNTGGFFIAALKLKKSRKTDLKFEKTTNIKENNIIYKSKKGDVIYYSVDPNIKQTIENVNSIKINGNLNLVSQSITNKKMSIVSEPVLEIMKSGSELLIFSAGHIAFTRSGLKYIGKEIYRPRNNVIKQFINEKQNIITLITSDVLKLLENEFIDNELLSIEINDIGIFTVKFEGFDDYFNLHCGPNKSGIMLNKNYKKTLKNLINNKFFTIN